MAGACDAVCATAHDTTTQDSGMGRRETAAAAAGGRATAWAIGTCQAAQPINGQVVGQQRRQQRQASRKQARGVTSTHQRQSDE